MTQLTHKKINLFADINPTGPSGEIYLAEFGAMKNGLTGYTKDVNLIQNTYYETGMITALLNGSPPPIQEIDALNYLITYALQYIQQTGISEYDALKTYDDSCFYSTATSIYRGVSGTTGQILKTISITTNNSTDYTVLSTDRYIGSIATGATIIRMPVANADNNGVKVFISRLSNYTVTIQGISGLIDGLATFVLSTTFDTVELISDGNDNWDVIGAHIT